MAEIDDGETAAAAATPDEIVNPGGFLIVYVSLLGPKNGDADVELRVNGAVVRSLLMPILAPDELRFDRAKLDDELRRFHSARRE